MKIFILLSTVLFFLLDLRGQADHNPGASKKIKASILKIEALPYMPPLSGDRRYWKIVKMKKPVIPLLISLIDDTTITPPHVRFWGGNYAVGDISVALMEEIVRNFKTQDLIMHNDPAFACQKNITNTYWCFVRSDPANRIRLKQWVEEWYVSHVDSLIWCQDTNLYHKREFILPSPVPEKEAVDLPSQKADSGRVPKRYFHPAGGFYLIKQGDYERFVGMTGCKCE